MPAYWRKDFEKEVLDILAEHGGRMRSGDLLSKINEKRQIDGKERRMSPTTLFKKTIPKLESKKLIETDRVSHKNVWYNLIDPEKVEIELKLAKIVERLGELLSLARTEKREFTKFVHKPQGEKEYKFITPEKLAKPNDDFAYIIPGKSNGRISFTIGNPKIGIIHIIYEPYGKKSKRSLVQSMSDLLTKK